MVAVNDYYRVMEGEQLDVNNQTDLTLGFLENDFMPGRPNEPFFVVSWFTVGSFQGRLTRIDRESNGLFRYDPADGT